MREQDNHLRAQLDKLRTSSTRQHAPHALSPEEARRLLKKGGRRSAPTPSSAPAILYQRSLPRTEPAPPVEASPQNRLILEEATDGKQIERPESGTCYLLSTEVSGIDGGHLLNRRFAQGFADGVSPLRAALDDLCGIAEPTPDKLVFLDVESTGLGSSQLFLIGVMVWREASFEVCQYLARNYAEEAAVIRSVVDDCRPREILVTFNGKSFDYPFIRARAAANGIPFDFAPVHLDLLHLCRRVWKDRLPNCKLQTLEEHVCGRTRIGDIPGCDIPDVYHSFVRTMDAFEMVEVLKHNLLDLITLADLMTRLPGQRQ